MARAECLQHGDIEDPERADDQPEIRVGIPFFHGADVPAVDAAQALTQLGLTPATLLADGRDQLSGLCQSIPDLSDVVGLRVN